MAAVQFFYDEQIRRFLLQFTRILSGFQVEYGRDDEGVKALYRVPIRYGDASRQAQTILQENSANSLPSTPLMTFYISQLTYARGRVQDPTFVDKKNIRQRTWDEESEIYETTQSNAFTVERVMPVPYDLEITLDIWTSNTNQKLQILEQILTLFNPSFEIQSTDSFIDWTSLSVINLSSTNWSSRSIPMGTENPIDIASLRFELPMWITPPAKVKKLGVVQKIISSLYDAEGNLSDAINNDDLLLGTRQKITPFGYQVLLLGNQLQVLSREAVVEGNTGIAVPESPPSNEFWHAVIDLYGELKAGISQIRLQNKYDNSVIVGTVAYHPSDDRFLLFTIDEDTLPSNTLSPVNAIVDPQRKGPGYGLPAAEAGQRYLLINDTGTDPYEGDAVAWRGAGGGTLYAKANDIIQYDGSVWNITFDSANLSDVQYVTNLTTSIQYRWADEQWLKSYEGLYPGGEWSFVP
jgi:hypothetical protein